MIIDKLFDKAVPLATKCAATAIGLPIVLIFRCSKGTQVTRKMDKPLGADDFAAMEGQLRGCVEADRHYWRVNDVKCDAIHTAKTYEEFADRVAAADLRPLEKADYKQKVPRGWNQYAARDISKEIAH